MKTDGLCFLGTAGDPVPLCKGWLRASLRAINTSHPNQRDYLPYREYRSTDVALVEPDTPYDLLVEIWPTACVISPGGKIIFEVCHSPPPSLVGTS